MGGLLAFALTATAETFRWVDAEGHVHFGDAPPPGVQAESIQVTPPKSKLTDEEARQQVQNLRAQQAEARARDEAKRTEAARKQQESLLEKASKLERCEKARWSLAALEGGRPVYRDEAGLFRVKPPPGQGDAYTGKRDYLDESARKSEINQQRRIARENCGAEPTKEQQEETTEQMRHAETCEQAAANLRQFTSQNSGATAEEVNAVRSFLSTQCGGGE